MSRFPSLKLAARVAVISFAAVGVAFAALPAQAAPSLGGTLQLDAPVKPQMQIQADPNGGSQTQMKKYEYDDDDWCLTKKQVRKGLKKAGFDEIDFVKDLPKHRVRVEALYEDDGWYYSMRIDLCDGEVDRIKPLYEADDFDIDFDF